MKKTVFYTVILFVLLFLTLMVINPDVCKSGAVLGITLSSAVIIPSLFPFSVFVLFVLKSNILNGLTPLNRIIKALFGLNGYTFSIFLLSLIGGYPIGAKLLSQAVELKKIDQKTASIMLNYCVNAGPAFIVLAVGSGMLNSKKIGYALLISHIFSSLLLALILRNKINITKAAPVKINLNVTDNFVSSVYESSAATLSICAYVVIFSVIINYVSFYSKKFIFLKVFGFLLEVTNAASQTKNVILISFLLGFSGVCIWFQIFGTARNFKINYRLFILFRIMHGILSSGFTYIIIKIFKLSVSTLSNGIAAYYSFTGSSLTVALSLICMGIIFIISLYSKKYAGNLLEDLV